MTASLREAAQMALDALEGVTAYTALLDDFTMTASSEALEAIRAALAVPDAKPAAWGMTTYQEIMPGIELGFDLFGGVDIRLGGEFVYVHINYDHRYTHNAARTVLANDIVKLLTTPKPPSAAAIGAAK